MKNKYSKLFRIIIFISLFISSFIFFQYLFMPIWNWPDYGSRIDENINEFRKVPKNTVNTLFLGTSHMGHGVIPLELYQKYGIVSYNLATENQSLDSSFLVLFDVYKHQTPSLVFFDISKIFERKDNNEADRTMLFDNAPLNRNKIRFVLAEGNGYSIKDNIIKLPEVWNKLVPFYQYHTRWKELSISSFKRFKKNSFFFLMGYNIFSSVTPFEAWKNGCTSVEDDESEIMARRNIIFKYLYKDKEYTEVKDSEHPLYAPKIKEEAYRYVSAMNNICEQHGSKLILTKIPNTGYPQYYEPTWTKINYEISKKFADELEIPFIDFKYDTKIDIDYSKDSIDGGSHLNLRGARKVTDAIGQYIKFNYPIQLNNYVPEINKKIPLYNKLASLCELQMEDTFPCYLLKLKSYCIDNDIIVFFTINDTGIFESTDTDKSALKAFGFQTNFYKNEHGDSFLAVFDDKEVKYECYSNREQSYDYAINNINITLYSSGYECGPKAGEIINQKDYALNRRGLNIVVYDKKANIVIDSVCFDFYDIDYSLRRDAGLISIACFEYEQYLLEHSEDVF